MDFPDSVEETGEAKTYISSRGSQLRYEGMRHLVGCQEGLAATVSSVQRPDCGQNISLVWIVVSWTGMYQNTLHCWIFFNLWFVLLDSLTSSIGYMHSLHRRCAAVFLGSCHMSQFDI